MQKRNIIYSILLVSVTLSMSIHAEQSEVVTENITPVPEAPVQEHISRMMQNDFAFNETVRRMSQELALAKLRLEMAKIRSEAAGLSPSPMPVALATPADTSKAITQAPEVVPKVLMITQLAGVSRAAVSVGTRTIFVRLGEQFPANGKQYTVHHSKGMKVPVVQEVSR